MTHSRPDPSSPWVVDTRLLDRRPGAMKRLDTTLTSDDRMGTDIFAVPAGEPVAVKIRLESVVEGVLVSGTAVSTATGECARCLKGFARAVGADLRELYAYPDSVTARTTEEDEVPLLVDGLIDLEQLVRDEIVVQMPLAPLCEPGCPGLCAVCGGRLAELEAGHSHEILDPRWAALRGQFGTRNDVEE